MQNTNDNIDLDALFDSLHIAAGQSDVAAITSVASISDVNTAEIPDLSPLDADFFLFDTPTDQS